MIIGSLRIKCEARWISRVIKSIQPICEKIIIFDDHSNDGTPEICEELGCEVHRSEFDGINEVRDKNFLLGKVWESGAQVGDWCLAPDGDELLYQPDIPILLKYVQEGVHDSFSFPICYLWDQEDQIRVDRWYANFHRPTVFRLTRRDLSFVNTGNGGQFHCGSIPHQLMPRFQKIPVRIIHLGYLHREDRIKKYNFYNSMTPVPKYEDGYRHICVGDLFPASSRFLHAGPLELKPFAEAIGSFV